MPAASRRVVGVEHIGELVGGSQRAAARLGWAAELLKADALRLLQVGRLC
jgi:hypothetical protein